MFDTKKICIKNLRLFHDDNLKLEIDHFDET